MSSPKSLLHIRMGNCMGITGSAISVSREIYIAFKHLLSLRQNLLHHDRSADHLLRNTFPPRMYFFCGKNSKHKIKKGSIWTTESLSKFEYGGGATILETAENCSVYYLLRKIKGYDLFVCEAQYHRTCHKECILYHSCKRSFKLQRV